MPRRLTLAAVLTVALCAAASAETGERVSTLADQRAVGITIYNAELALVRDRRRVTLPAGESRLALRDVSARIQPETALLQSVLAPGRINVIEQNFDYDLLSPQKLLEKYVGRDVEVIHTDPHTGAERRETSRVLSTNGGVVLRYANRIETSIDGRIAFPALPSDLRDRPTLVTNLAATNAGEQDIELTYLSGGLNWKADYTAELTPKDDRIDLRGLITLQNSSGTAYRDASVQLVAGDVNVVRSAFQPSPMPLRMIGATTARSSSVVQQELLEYHLYTLARRTTILDNQTKQVELLTAPDVAVTKTLELRGQPYYYTAVNGDLGRQLKVATYLSFRNEGASLGIPIPRGTVRVYKRDTAGTAQFVGSDNIDHTPKGESIRLHLGDSFDVTANKKQTDYRAVDPNTYESAYEIVLRNAKAVAQTVLVVEPIPGEWTILQSSARYQKSSSSTATWTLTVPPQGSTTLTYRVRVKR
jgi:hypothetical protein